MGDGALETAADALRLLGMVGLSLLPKFDSLFFSESFFSRCSRSLCGGLEDRGFAVDASGLRGDGTVGACSWLAKDVKLAGACAVCARCSSTIVSLVYPCAFCDGRNIKVTRFMLYMPEMRVRVLLRYKSTAEMGIISAIR